VSLCVFTFNSFCRRPRATQQRAATPRFNTISNETRTPPPPPPPVPAPRPRAGAQQRRWERGKRVRGYRVNNERARQERGEKARERERGRGGERKKRSKLANFSPSPFSFLLHLLLLLRRALPSHRTDAAVFLRLSPTLSLSLSSRPPFFPPASLRRPQPPRGSLRAAALHMDRNSEKLIFLRPTPHRAPRRRPRISLSRMRGFVLFRGKEGRDRSSDPRGRAREARRRRTTREAAAGDTHLHASRCVGSRAWRPDAVCARLAFDSEHSRARLGESGCSGARGSPGERGGCNVATP